MKAATSINRNDLLHVGVCLGKFSKNGKFLLHVTALEYLSQYAKYKVWVKLSAEMSFLYGHRVTKQGLARMTENTPQYAGVVVYSLFVWVRGEEGSKFPFFDIVKKSSRRVARYPVTRDHTHNASFTIPRGKCCFFSPVS
jgi:hypothetical protein